MLALLSVSVAVSALVLQGFGDWTFKPVTLYW